MIAGNIYDLQIFLIEFIIYGIIIIVKAEYVYEHAKKVQLRTTRFLNIVFLCP